MNKRIEELVKKHAGRHYDSEADLRAALTEMAAEHEQKFAGLESEAILSRALSERIRQLEAERVPVSVLEGMVNLVEGIPVYYWRCAKHGARLKDTPEWMRFYCAAKKAMLAAAPQQKKEVV